MLDGKRPMALEESVTRLIASSRQSADCYRAASERLLTQPAISHFFEEQASHHELAAKWLEEKLAEQGKRPLPGILASPEAEGWSDPAATEFNPKAIIRACHKSEEMTAQAFERAPTELPVEWGWQMRQYLENMRSAIAKLHAWLENQEIGPGFG
jgi:hypothetical protein